MRGRRGWRETLKGGSTNHCVVCTAYCSPTPHHNAPSDLHKPCETKHVDMFGMSRVHGVVLNCKCAHGSKVESRCTRPTLELRMRATMSQVFTPPDYWIKVSQCK